MKNKILFLLPHASSGGMPQFSLKRIELLKDDYEIYVVEYACVSLDYVVQRNQIINLLENRFFTLDDNKELLIDIIDGIMPDIVHLEHESEGFDLSIMKKLYRNDRPYRIVETCHNITFNPKDKLFIPDAFAFCTPYHLKTFSEIETEKALIEYPIEDKILNDKYRLVHWELAPYTSKINVLNVGLWTKGKNQAETIEIARKYPYIIFHFVGNQAVNFKDYWQPLMENLPSNCIVWGERDDVSEFMYFCDYFMFNSVHECNPLVLKEAISHNMKIFAHSLPQYGGMYDKYIMPIEKFEIHKHFFETKSYKIKDETEDFVFNSKQLYKLVIHKEIKQQTDSKYEIITHFVDGAYLEVKGFSLSNFKVQFSDQNGAVVYENTIGCNEWVKLNRKYFTEYLIKVWENEELVFEETLSLENKKVMICFDSNALGDTLAWMPYCDEFQRKHKCQLIVSTFKNFLFKDEYPNIKFIEPNTVETDLYAKYNLGWYYDLDKEPILPSTIPLQQTATNILGLEFKEIKPRVVFDFDLTKKKHDSNNYITIAPDSTSGCKEWSLENWQEVVDYYVERGYGVINVSLNSKYKLSNVTTYTDSSLDFTMNLIRFSEIFIGLSSGLSWLAWSLNTHVVMIANFTERSHEFQTGVSRLTNNKVCNGCWNNKNFKFDKSDWTWCPIWKGYDRQFECQKGITPKNVIKAVDLKLERHTGKYRKSSN
jgi:autotransporter strand-loop-strand O-heptosyltransferase